MRTIRRPACLLLAPLVFLAVLVLVHDPARAQRPDEEPPAQVSGVPLAANWEEVERLVDEQKYEAALEVIGRIREAAQAGGDDEEWARALGEETALRVGLHGYETAVRFLREQPWPEDALQRAALNLVYAHSLVTYVRAYGWEIRQRERVEARGEVDLKAWTADQIAAAARRVFVEAWALRKELGRLPIDRLSRFLEPNSYPAEVRGTLRDAVSYLFVELLADSSLWSPAESNDLFRIAFDALLEGDARASAALKLDDPAVHPLVALGAVLDDLEAWHTQEGRPEAALEARLERTRRLHAAFTAAPRRARIRADLERHLPAFRDVTWWAEGIATLAELVRQDPAEDALVRAHALAREGHQAYPESVGGRRCLSIQRSIEAPDFQLASMSHDHLDRRSLQVTHRNLGALHFRAYAVDLVSFVEAQQDAQLLPAYQAIERIVDERTPVVSWSEELPGTPDFRSHRTFVTPPLQQPGLHVVVASAREDFAREDNRLQAVNLVVSDLVLLTRHEPGGVEVGVVSGSAGEPVAGADVTLYRADWQKGHTRVATLRTPARGAVTFRHTRARQRNGHFLVARRGADVAIDTSFLHFSPDSRPGERTASLVYTDRSVYRPRQSVRFKVLVFHGGGEQARFMTRPETPVTISLVDPNNETVETRSLTTNAFGSASGEFTVPSGRLLGRWTVRSSLQGAASVRVEEYKRPTFETRLLEPEKALRLNREASLRGEARYYFGLPVAGGEVRWRVVREPVYPWWWGWWGRSGGSSGTQTIAAGTTDLDADGGFRFSFTPEAGEEEGKGITYRYSVSADVTDEGGETRSASRSFRLGHVAIEATIQPPTAFLRAGQAAEVSVVRSDLDGVGRAGEASWRLVALRQPAEALLPADHPLPEDPPDAYRTPGDALRARWDTGVPHAAVLRSWPDGDEETRGTLTHDEKGRATVELPELTAGAYRLHYETKDVFGTPYETAKELIVAADRTPLALPLALLAESGSVRVGEVARLLVHSGLEDQPLVLDIWRGGRRVDRRRLRNGPSLVEIPIGEKDRGGLGVTLTGVRDHQLLRATQTVFVPWDDRELKVSFASFRDELRPGTRETWRVSVEGASAEAGTAELLAYMYDRSLDIFEPHHPASVLGLLPNWTGVGHIRSNLGQTGPAWSRDHGFASVPSAPSLIGDRVKGHSGYGIGGLGRRQAFKMGAADMAVAESVALAPAPASRVVGVHSLEQAEAEPREEKARLSKASLDDVSGGSPEEPAPLRTDFSETAFWEPHLLLDREGVATIEFTVPDSVTSWNVWVHAVTRDLKGGSLKREVRTVKDLMVRPYLPRFLREGDAAELKVVVNNASESELSGEVMLEILDPDTEESLASEFGLSGPPKPFRAAAGGGADVTFSVRAPRRVGAVAFKVVARAGDLSDGELRPVPLLPGRLHLAQSRFVALKPGSRRTLSFPDMARDDDPSRLDEQLVVTVDGQLFLGVLQALPYLVNYPYECTEQTLNRFLSTGILTSLYDQYPSVKRWAKELSTRDTRLETWDAPDPNRKLALEETPWLQQSRGGRETNLPLANTLDPRIAHATRVGALARLAKAQTSLGAFPWFPGGPPSPYMTLYVLHGFSKGLEFGVEVPKDVVQRAWGYMHRHYVDEWAREAMAHDCCWEWITFLNYVLSSYPDASWTGGVFSEEERKTMLDFSFRHWREHSPYLKAYLTLTLERAGRTDDAQLVFDSVMDSAKTDEDLGTYWAPEDRAWLWYNDTIETHAFALRTLAELSPKDERRAGLVQWLFLNKKLNHWKSTRATAEVLYSLAYYLRGEGALGVTETVDVTVGEREPTRFVFEPEASLERQSQLVLTGDELEPATDATVVVEKEGPGLAFASATWHFSTERMPESGSGDLLSVTRTYFQRVDRPDGPALVPLAEGTTLRPGDEVEVHLSLRARHEAEYIHLRDPRAAGLEPVSQVSKHKCDLGIAWYEEVRDSGTNFFFEKLPVGEYTFKYRLRVAMAGTFRVGPATAQSMYAPEFAAYSAGAVLEATPGE